MYKPYTILSVYDILNDDKIEILKSTIQYYKNFYFKKNTYEINKTKNNWKQTFGNINLNYFTPDCESVINSIFDKIIEKYYPNESADREYSLQFYKEGHFIDKHKDGGNLKVFTFIIYLNDDWQKEQGGELIMEDGYEIIPHWETIVLMDFTNNNVAHEVKEIKSGIRYAIYCSFQKK